MSVHPYSLASSVFLRRLLLLAQRRDHLIDVRDDGVEMPRRGDFGGNGGEAERALPSRNLDTPFSFSFFLSSIFLLRLFLFL